MYKIISFLVISLFSSLSMSANLPDFPFVVSTGYSEVDVKPDLATLRLGVVGYEIKSDQALETVNIATSFVVTIAKKYGIDIKDVEATDLEKSTKRKKDSQYNRLEILGYEVSRSIIIKLNSLDNYSGLMNDIISINNISRARSKFDISNREEIESTLTVEASANAKKKAESMAKSLGTEIHSVYAISQTSDFGEFFATFGATSRQIQADLHRSDSFKTIMFAPETINISQGINVVFRIK